MGDMQLSVALYSADGGEKKSSIATLMFSIISDYFTVLDFSMASILFATSAYGFCPLL